jgi:transposase
VARKKYVVTLEAEERVELQRMVSSGKGAARKLTHARILLLADAGPEGPGRTDEQIVDSLGVGERTVARVRQRFVEDGCEAAVKPRPRPRQPSKLEGDVEEQIVALAKSDPPEGRARWTLRLIAGKVVQLELLDEVSHESVRKVLKKTG